jgi:hypothetical protein
MDSDYEYSTNKRRKGKDKGKEKNKKYGKFNQKYVRLKLEQLNKIKYKIINNKLICINGFAQIRHDPSIMYIIVY